MQKSSLQILNTGARIDPLVDRRYTPIQKIQRFADDLIGLVRGRRLPTVVDRDTLCAWQTCVAGTSGDTVLTIGGVDITVTYATSQTVTAGLLVAAVNASTTALAKGGVDVEADNRKATITLTSCAVGTIFTIGQWKFTAVAKAPNDNTQFEVSGNDTADAGTLVAAINATPGLQDIVCASNSAGVVTVFSRRASTPARDLAINGTGEVVSAAVLTASTTVCVSSVRKGLPGNHITCAITGTGTSIAGARLAGGTTTRATL
jgi:hypothetical protein